MIPLIVLSTYCSSTKQVVKQEPTLQNQIIAVHDSSNDSLYKKIDTLDKKIDTLDKKTDTLEKKIEPANEDMPKKGAADYNSLTQLISAPKLGVKMGDVKLVKGRTGFARYATTKRGFYLLTEIANDAFLNNPTVNINEDPNSLVLKAATFAKNWAVKKGIGTTEEEKDILTEKTVEEFYEIYMNPSTNK